VVLDFKQVSRRREVSRYWLKRKGTGGKGNRHTALAESRAFQLAALIARTSIRHWRPGTQKRFRKSRRFSQQERRCELAGLAVLIRRSSLRASVHFSPESNRSYSENMFCRNRA